MHGFTQGQLRQHVAKALVGVGALPRQLAYRWWLVDRPSYAYGLMRAAGEAEKLGYRQITAIEFGVGAGGGLVALEQHATAVQRLTGVECRVFGFDTGRGLPAPTDYRDIPYAWRAGDYSMDENALRSRLSSARLVLGDVRETLAGVLTTEADHLRAAPIGFVAFDLDYWSSTLAAFGVFRRDPAICLPRVMCYFDDLRWYVEDVGELRAIRDFNEEDEDRRIRPQHGLRSLIPFQPPWADDVYQAHLFSHPLYSVHLMTGASRSHPANIASSAWPTTPGGAPNRNGVRNPGESSAV